MSVLLVGSLPLGAINVSANTALTLAIPLLTQIDLLLTSPFGLASISADLAAQLQGQLALQASLKASLVPTSNVAASLRAVLNIQAQIQGLLAGAASLKALIALGVPSISLQIASSISASAALSGKLAVRVGGIKALLQATLTVKNPAVTFFADLSAHLAAGPVVLLSVGAGGTNTLASAGDQLKTLLNTGVGGLSPSDTVYGLVLLTKEPSVWASLQATLRTS